MMGKMDVSLSHNGNKPHGCRVSDQKRMSESKVKKTGLIFARIHLGVSKNRGTPKWMVKIMENPIKMDDLGGKPTIFGNIHFQERLDSMLAPITPTE